MSDEWEQYLQQPPTRPVPDDIHYTHEGNVMKLADVKLVKEAVKRFLPLAEMIAARTPNSYDDVVVALLKKLLADDAKLAALLDVK